MLEQFPMEKSWDFENGFYLTAAKDRLSKLIAHYELFKMTLDVPGDIVEFGVFKGVSLSQWCIFRSMFSNEFSKRILAFDVFDKFPPTKFRDDVKSRERFIRAAGSQSISHEEMKESLEARGLYENTKLIKGDILQTLPEYLKENPQARFSLINLDTDLYEPAKCVLEFIWDRIVPGGVLILDNYGVFAGETVAVEEFFSNKDGGMQIKRFPFAMAPSYIMRK